MTPNASTNGRSRVLTLLLHVGLIVFAALQLAPLIWIALSSFKSNLEITGANIVGLPQHWKWTNYSYVLTATNLGLSLLNSLFYTSVTVVASCLLSAMVAYAVTRMRWRLSKVTLTIFMTGLMIPVHATLLPVFLMFKTVGLLNTPWALVIPYTVAALPSTIFILTGFFLPLPRELEESAVIDGCNIFQVFWHIMLPLVKSAIASTAVFTFLAAWNELMFATTFINKPELMPITVAINSLRGVHFSEYGAMFAGLVLATLPAVVIYAVFSELIQKSMVAGAVKG
jgi:raffinose/stachyose/melibiose transport system permease protein